MVHKSIANILANHRYNTAPPEHIGLRSYAETLGFAWEDNSPQTRTSFVRGDWHVWYCRQGWRRARLCGNGHSIAVKYRDHMPFLQSLKQTLDETPKEDTDEYMDS